MSTTEANITYGKRSEPIIRMAVELCKTRNDGEYPTRKEIIDECVVNDGRSRNAFSRKIQSLVHERKSYDKKYWLRRAVVNGESVYYMSYDPDPENAVEVYPDKPVPKRAFYR